MDLTYELPCENKYTIYSKSGCINCKKAKTLLEKEEFNVINCDDYLLDDKESFLSFIKSLTNNIEHKTFPMIFYKKKFIGGYNELQEFYQNQINFDLNTDF